MCSFYLNENFKVVATEAEARWLVEHTESYAKGLRFHASVKTAAGTWSGNSKGWDWTCRLSNPNRADVARELKETIRASIYADYDEYRDVEGMDIHPDFAFTTCN